MLFFALPLAAFLAVFLLGPWAVRVCQVRGLMAAHEDDRHIHTCPTPHGGGFILPLVVVPLALFAVWHFALPFKEFLTVLLLGSIPVAVIGWMDDHYHVNPSTRLLLHLVAVGLSVIFIPPLFDFMPLWAEKLLLTLAWGWFVNLYNFMDGADGLATSETIFIALATCFIIPDFSAVALILAAAAAAFLRINAPQAKVFMGDVSSTWLGYILGGLLLVGCSDDTWTIIWPLATLTLVFTADATSTLIRRVATGHRPWQPHRTFWFHRFLEKHPSHRTLLAAVLGLNLLLLAAAKVSLHLGHPELGFFAGGVVIFCAACYIRARTRA